MKGLGDWTILCMGIQVLEETWHIGHFWVSYGRCAMPRLPMVWSEAQSRQWAD